jgi:Cu-processing system permease protein
MYNSSEFIELILSQPIQRKTIWKGFLFGLSIALSIAFLLSVALPVFLFVHSISAFMIIFVGLLLTNIFVAIALLASVKIRDKAKGIGVAILLWMYFSLLFDAFVLFLLFQFGDYPIEKPMIIVSSLNPIDLGRVLVLLQLDVSAMMGYTGAIFKDYYGTSVGISISMLVLFAWYIIPLLFSTRFFQKKDL